MIRSIETTAEAVNGGKGSFSGESLAVESSPSYDVVSLPTISEPVGDLPPAWVEQQRAEPALPMQTVEVFTKPSTETGRPVVPKPLPEHNPIPTTQGKDTSPPRYRRVSRPRTSFS